MKLASRNVRLALDGGELVGIDRATGVQVVCEEGRVWITEESSNGDVWLRAGERAILRGCGLAVLEASGAARIHLSEVTARA